MTTSRTDLSQENLEDIPLSCVSRIKNKLRYYFFKPSLQQKLFPSSRFSVLVKMMKCLTLINLPHLANAQTQVTYSFNDFFDPANMTKYRIDLFDGVFQPDALNSLLSNLGTHIFSYSIVTSNATNYYNEGYELLYPSSPLQANERFWRFMNNASRFNISFEESVIQGLQVLPKIGVAPSMELLFVSLAVFGAVGIINIVCKRKGEEKKSNVSYQNDRRIVVNIEETKDILETKPLIPVEKKMESLILEDIVLSALKPIPVLKPGEMITYKNPMSPAG